MSISLIPKTFVPIEYEITIDGNIMVYHTNCLELFRTPSILFRHNDLAAVDDPVGDESLLPFLDRELGLVDELLRVDGDVIETPAIDQNAA